MLFFYFMRIFGMTNFTNMEGIDKAQELMELWMEESSMDYRRLMAYYECAIMEVETKFKVLSKNFSLGDDCNPIESIQSRLKSSRSIFKKMQKKGLPLTVEAIEKNLHDIAGVRVICSFVDDIYAVADMLTRQDDVGVVMVKDYIRHPKDNGYRSYHMIIEVPVFFSEQKQYMRVEVQIRTIAMDFWASLDHELKYKKEIPNAEEISRELRECADIIAGTDEKMLAIRKRIEGRGIRGDGDWK